MLDQNLPIEPRLTAPPPLHASVSSCLLILSPVLIPWLIFIYAGINGVDFGMHWDENDHLGNVQHSLLTQTLLPTGGFMPTSDTRLAVGDYGYPSVIYWITLASAAPEIIANSDDVTKPKLLDFVTSDAFRLRVRSVCVVITSLTIVWVYLAVLRCRRRWMEALFAASVLAGSWELSYHSRWIAPDAIMMQFAALCLWLCMAALGSACWKKWAKWAAVAAGLAAGTKYPGALMLGPVCFIAWVQGGRLRFLVKLCAVAFGVFLITTPGAILQPWAFIHWLGVQQHHYAMETHLGYTVTGAADHLWKIAVYEAIVFSSHQPLLAAMFSLLSLAGAVDLLRTDWRRACVLAGFPLLYLLYFGSQRVMIVRNLLTVSPFLAVLCASGAAGIIKLVRSIAARRAVAAVLAAMVCFNMVFVVYASLTIRQAGLTMIYDVVNLQDEINRHPNTRYDLTPAARDLLSQLDPSAANRPAPANPDREVVVAASRSGNDWLQWPANQWDLVLGQFGPYEVNFNYYPTWLRNRLIMISLDQARALPVESIQSLLRQRDADTRKAP